MNQTSAQAVRNRIRELRVKAGWSQQDLAHRADTTRQTINAIELEKYLPSLELAFRLARIFDTDVETIFQDPHRRQAQATALLTQVPAKDFTLSRAFYVEIGFTEVSCDGVSAEMELDSQRFLLRDQFNSDFVAHFSMQLRVPEIERWWQRLRSLNLADRYPGIMLRAPSSSPTGQPVISLTDPAGVLWHICAE